MGGRKGCGELSNAWFGADMSYDFRVARGTQLACLNYWREEMVV